MNRKSFLVSVLLCFSFCLCAEEKLFSTKIIQYQEFEYAANVQKVKAIISYDELCKDLDALCYLLENTYSGFNDMVARGFDVEKFRSSVLSHYSADVDEFDSRKLCFDFIDNLSPYIQDNHFGFKYFLDDEKLCKKSLVYWTNIFVSKGEDDYEVCESKVDYIKKGMKFTDEEDRLFVYPVKGDGIYRVGVVSNETLAKAKINFNNTNYNVPLINDGAISTRYEEQLKYHEIETDDSAYICLSSFTLPSTSSIYHKGAEIILEKFSALGFKYRDKKNVIIDLRSNGGEYFEPFKYLLGGLYFKKFKVFDDKAKKMIDSWYEDNVQYFEKIDSPAVQNILYQKSVAQNDLESAAVYKKLFETEKKSPARNVFVKGEKSVKLSDEKGAFQGNLIILIDRNTGSASEVGISLAKILFGKYKQITLIGENSLGKAVYSNLSDVFLPNSQIQVHISFWKNLGIRRHYYWMGEGIGFYPDIWSTAEDLNESLFMVTGDEQMKEKLSALSSGLQ